MKPPFSFDPAIAYVEGMERFQDWKMAEEHAKRELDAGKEIELHAYRGVNEDGYVTHMIDISTYEDSERRRVGTYTLEDE